MLRILFKSTVYYDPTAQQVFFADFQHKSLQRSTHTIIKYGVKDVESSNHSGTQTYHRSTEFA